MVKSKIKPEVHEVEKSDFAKFTGNDERNEVYPEELKKKA